MTEANVTHRAQQVLKILVERYIQEGFPIGSKTIAEEYALGISSATIRNILADLENGGFLISPHPSAGRIPTELGYRFFVNSLLTVTPLEGDAILDLKNKLDPDLNLSSLMKLTSSLLSEVTQMISVVTLPKRNRQELRQIEFLGLSSNRILVILVLNNREVQNRVIYTDKIYSQSELQQAANYFNSHYVGKDLLSARQELLAAIKCDQDHLTQLLQTTIDVISKTFTTDEENKGCYIAGQNHLVNYIKEASLERLRLLLTAFTEKNDILNLLDHALDAEGVQIFIGKESGCEAFDDCSIVTTSYSVDGKLIGSLGVIGPKRMPYDKVIPAVDVTARLLSSALSQM